MAEAVLNRQSFKAGQTIFEKSDAPHFAYIVQAGAVDIVVKEDGNDVVVDTLTAGEVFGEMALVDEQPRSARAIAKQATTCVLITKAEFERRLTKVDPFTRSMLMLLTKRLRQGHPGILALPHILGVGLTEPLRAVRSMRRRMSANRSRERANGRTRQASKPTARTRARAARAGAECVLKKDGRGVGWPRTAPECDPCPWGYGVNLWRRRRLFGAMDRKSSAACRPRGFP